MFALLTKFLNFQLWQNLSMYDSYSMNFHFIKISFRSLGENGIGDQTRHLERERRLADVCQTKSIAREKSVDDYDF